VYHLHIGELGTPSNEAIVMGERLDPELLQNLKYSEENQQLGQIKVETKDLPV
jgi:hypothetical protein